MYMTDGEIYRSWKLAKNPGKQIQILAELNNCKKKIIEEIVERKIQEMNAKYSDETKAEIVKLRENGIPVKQVAEQFGIKPQAVSDICHAAKKSAEQKKMPAPAATDTGAETQKNVPEISNNSIAPMDEKVKPAPAEPEKPAEKLTDDYSSATVSEIASGLANALAAFAGCEISAERDKDGNICVCVKHGKERCTVEVSV